MKVVRTMAIGGTGTDLGRVACQQKKGTTNDDTMALMAFKGRWATTCYDDGSIDRDSDRSISSLNSTRNSSSSSSSRGTTSARRRSINSSFSSLSSGSSHSNSSQRSVTFGRVYVREHQRILIPTSPPSSLPTKDHDRCSKKSKTRKNKRKKKKGKSSETMSISSTSPSPPPSPPSLLALGWDYTDKTSNVFDTLEDFETSKHPSSSSPPSSFPLDRPKLLSTSLESNLQSRTSTDTKKSVERMGKLHSSSKLSLQDEPNDCVVPEAGDEGNEDDARSSVAAVGTTSTTLIHAKRLNELERLTLLNCYGFTLKEIKAGEERKPATNAPSSRTGRWRREKSRDESFSSHSRRRNSSDSATLRSTTPFRRGRRYYHEGVTTTTNSRQERGSFKEHTERVEK